MTLKSKLIFPLPTMMGNNELTLVNHFMSRHFPERLCHYFKCFQ